MAASSPRDTTFMSEGVSSSRAESPRLSAASEPSTSWPSTPTSEKSGARGRLKNAASSLFLASMRFFSLANAVCSRGLGDLIVGVRPASELGDSAERSKMHESHGRIENHVELRSTGQPLRLCSGKTGPLTESATYVFSIR